MALFLVYWYAIFDRVPASPGHFQTMIDPRCDCIGVGVTQYDGITYCYMFTAVEDMNSVSAALEKLPASATWIKVSNW